MSNRLVSGSFLNKVTWSVDGARVVVAKELLHKLVCNSDKLFVKIC